MLASLRGHPRLGTSSSDALQDRARAREAFDRVSKTIELEDVRNGGNQALSRAARSVIEDLDMHIEIARLWQGENLERMGRSLNDALRISKTRGQVDPRLLNNLGALQHLENNLAEARTLYESALTSASSLPAEAGENMSISILYNLARVYEDAGDDARATDAYEKLLSRHPEYVDGMSFPTPPRCYAQGQQPKFGRLRCSLMSIVAMMLMNCSSNP